MDDTCCLRIACRPWEAAAEGGLRRSGRIAKMPTEAGRIIPKEARHG
jgi:hypothetical protein